MWEGIDYVIDISKPINSRITKINYKNNPLNMEGDYAVVMNNYRAGGGGDYPNQDEEFKVLLGMDI